MVRKAGAASVLDANADHFRIRLLKKVPELGYGLVGHGHRSLAGAEFGLPFWFGRFEGGRLLTGCRFLRGNFSLRNAMLCFAFGEAHDRE